MPTFVDMFAGAGGFSEGFLQAEWQGQQFDFLLASDINPTCEVTHRMRYNEQLGLDTEFLTKDITEPDFVEQLEEKIYRRWMCSPAGRPASPSVWRGSGAKTTKKMIFSPTISRSLRPYAPSTSSWRTWPVF